MSRSAKLSLALAACAATVWVGVETAQAQNHWPRHHPVPPLSELLPQTLPAPQIYHPEAKKNEKPKRSRHDRDGGFTYTHPGFNARVGADGQVTFEDVNIRGGIFLVPPFIFIAGTLDITDVVMRWLGQDPYQYAKKAFLERTFAERMRMRRRYDKAIMARALYELPRYLAAVWRQPWSPELRRRVLFVLWDECAERGNKLVREGGAQARKMISRFIALNLPPGSPNGYRVAELARLNRRRTSSAPFAPYADLPKRTLVARHSTRRRSARPPRPAPGLNLPLMQLAASF